MNNKTDTILKAIHHQLTHSKSQTLKQHTYTINANNNTIIATPKETKLKPNKNQIRTDTTYLLYEPHLQTITTATPLGLDWITIETADPQLIPKITTQLALAQALDQIDPKTIFNDPTNNQTILIIEPETTTQKQRLKKTTKPKTPKNQQE